MAASIGSADGDAGFQIAPMVDVVFVLMLFFMACAGSQVVERELNVNLPALGGPARDVAIIIDITEDGRVLANNQLYGQASDKDLNALRDWFTNLIQTFGTDDPIIIRPNSHTRHERIMDVLNAAAAAGVKSLSFG